MLNRLDDSFWGLHARKVFHTSNENTWDLSKIGLVMGMNKSKIELRKKNTNLNWCVEKYETSEWKVILSHLIDRLTQTPRDRSLGR